MLITVVNLISYTPAKVRGLAGMVVRPSNNVALYN